MASNCGLVQCRMDVLFHQNSPLSSMCHCIVAHQFP
jgi:hypothetical protein